jgi:hypothetical protein
MSGISDALTAEQEQALQLYLGGASISEVADAVKVPPEEVREWMRGEGFRFALAEALLDERELERQRLGRLKELALDTIEEGLRSEDDSQRMAAAKAVLDWPGRAVLGARGTKAGVWIASVAAVLIVASWAMIGVMRPTCPLRATQRMRPKRQGHRTLRAAPIPRRPSQLRARSLIRRLAPPTRWQQCPLYRGPCQNRPSHRSNCARCDLRLAVPPRPDAQRARATLRRSQTSHPSLAVPSRALAEPVFILRAPGAWASR